MARKNDLNVVFETPEERELYLRLLKAMKAKPKSDVRMGPCRRRIIKRAG